MLTIILSTLLISTINCHPLNEEKKYQDDLNLVAYVENFKSMMSNYIKAHYNNLTLHEEEAVKDALEEFLHNFASDLKDIFENNDVGEIIPVYDGIPDSTFDEVKRNIKNELPHMSDQVADKIVYRLRRNLLFTRQKLDRIVNDSRRAQLENSSNE